MIGRYRGISPSFFQHGDLYDLEQSTGGGDGGGTLPIRLAFAGLWCWSDREGRFEWKPRELKLNILPYDQCDFSRVLDALQSGGFVVRYEIGGRIYGWIPTFTKHQSINGREAASSLPAPPPEVFQRAQSAELLGGFHQYDNGSNLTCESREVDASATRGAPVTPEVKGNEVKGNEVNRDNYDGEVDLEGVESGAGSQPEPEATPPGLSLAQVEQIAPLKGKGAPLPAIEGKRTMVAVRNRLAQVAGEVRMGTRVRVEREQLRVLQSEVVFGYWCAKTGHEKSIFDPKRERYIIKQLEMNGGNVSELLYAIDGSMKDDHLQGRRPDSTRKYDGIETIFRDRAQVERLADLMPKHRAGETHRIVTKYAEAMNLGGSNDPN